ncbi:MAG: methyl-accepting chemotaxis protein [Spirochaetales bacterium]|nr:methyl-accepting chemotaxis protein [Spirochaetales bacterium]
MSIQKKIQLTILLFSALFLAGLGAFVSAEAYARQEEFFGRDLLQIARALATHIDGNAHEKIEQTDSAEFLEIHNFLLKSRLALDLPEDWIYTIKPKNSREMQFVVMTHPRKFMGHTLNRSAEMNAVLADGRPRATRLYASRTGIYISAFAPVKNSSGAIVALLEVDRSIDLFKAEIIRALLPALAFLILAFLLTFLVSGFVARRIARPLHQIIARMEEIKSGAGDLTQKMNLQGRDEIAQAGALIDQFIEGVAETVRRVKGFSRSVMNSARELNNISQDFLTSSQEEAGLIQDTTSANEELTASLSQINSNAAEQEKLIHISIPVLKELLDFLKKVEKNARSVNENLEHTSSEISAGAGVLSDMIHEIENINHSSQKIDEIVTIIQGIADRVTLLALNASIEAARAGEQGRGFAIVAEEVSRLAENTTRQIKNIREIARNNRLYALASMEKSHHTAEVYQRINDFVKAALNLSQLNFQQAMEQQEPALRGEAALKQITGFSREISQAVTEQLKGTEDVAGSMIELSRLSGLIAERVGKMQLHIRAMEDKTEALNIMLERLQA